jgi:membrane-associated tyrosine- and threonine-specific cdc2-inhibitory kinase
LNSSCYDSSKRSSYYEQCFDQISKIGEGSFGEVFKVKSHEDGKMYAVKKTKQMYRSENHRRESLEEVRRYEEFSNNQHCIRLYKAWEQDDLLYIQIELCKGSVESYIAEVKRAPEEFVWSFLLDMLKALKSLHERNLVHLDVKLDNILITEDRICKLADFGLVFDLQNSPKSKAVEGDSRYLAPELLRGEYSLANDVFSLGITLLELATNLELPSNGKLWHELRTGHLPETATNLLSKDLQIIIREMMEEDPKKRPTVEKLLQKPILRKLNFKRQIKTIGNNSVIKRFIQF